MKKTTSADENFALKLALGIPFGLLIGIIFFDSPSIGIIIGIFGGLLFAMTTKDLDIRKKLK